jgi:hypothetical protein
LSDEEGMFFSEEESQFLPHSPAGGVIITGKLLTREQFPLSDEYSARLHALERFTERFRDGGLIFGDLTKGGQTATEQELIELEGVVENIPKGLVRCDVCGRFRGRCLDPSEEFRGKVMRVYCRCANWNRCARCGRTLYHWRLNSNYFKETDGHIWHVPAFILTDHKCSTIHELPTQRERSAQ